MAENETKTAVTVADSSIDQRDQSVNNQVNVIGDATIKHVGDMVNIANAYFTFSGRVVEETLKALLFGQEEDLAAETISRRGEWEPETLFVPAGPFLMGSQPGKGIPDHETPQFTMHLPAYRIGKYPVTNRQFVRFVEEFDDVFDSPKARAMGWTNNNRPPEEELDFPVKGITWYEALAYCCWLSQKTERPYTLPSEAQWEKTARGNKGLIFPWGDDWQNGQFCHTDYKKSCSVHAFEECASPYGCVDMVGNVREWTTTKWGRNRLHNLDLGDAAYPWNNSENWRPNVAPDRLIETPQMRQVTRGGASLLPHLPLRAARRQSEFPQSKGIRGMFIGFRIVLNLEEKNGSEEQ